MSLAGVRYSGGEYVQAISPSSTTLGIDLLGTSTRTAGSIGGDLWHVSNTTWCHLAIGDGTVAATAANMLLAPGERLLAIPSGSYIAAIKATGQPDGILRMTAAR